MHIIDEHVAVALALFYHVVDGAPVGQPTEVPVIDEELGFQLA